MKCDWEVDGCGERLDEIPLAKPEHAPSRRPSWSMGGGLRGDSGWPGIVRLLGFGLGTL